MPKRTSEASETESPSTKKMTRAKRTSVAKEPVVKKVGVVQPSNLVSKKHSANVIEGYSNDFFVEINSLLNVPKEQVRNFMTPIRVIVKKIIEDLRDVRSWADYLMRKYLLSEIIQLKDRAKRDLFLDLSVSFAREDFVSPSLPVTLLTDLVQLSSLEECESVFEYIEKRLLIWKEPFFLNSGKNAVLRMSNDLLRRLSRAQNTIFCGRILIFLSNYFPFSERSGLNIMSEFNLDNYTVYKSGDGSDDPEDAMSTFEEKEEQLFEGVDISIPGLDKILTKNKEEKKNRMKVDYNLYIKFWSLQDYFRNPVQCYNKISWKTFTMYASDVLAAFTFFKIEDHDFTREMEKMEIDPRDNIASMVKLGSEDLYFAKYLTNRRLLELQMSDASFRRYFLVQLLVILQYLTSPVKFKSDNYTLSEEQIDYVKKTTDKIYEQLAEIPPSGADFVNAIQHTLKREELWNRWKNDGCPQFQKPTPAVIHIGLESGEKKPVDSSGIEIDQPKPKKKVKKPLGEILKDANKFSRYLMGNRELTRLWNICPDNLKACRAKVRAFMPPVDIFFTEAIKEIESDPSPFVLPTEANKKDIVPKKLLGNSDFGWRALRVLARRSPLFFQMFSSSPIHPMQVYLEYILRKIMAETQVLREETQESVLNQNNAELKGGESPEVGETKEAKGEKSGDEKSMNGEESEDEGKKDIDMIDEELEKIHEEERDEGEMKDEKLRNLNPEEESKLGKGLGDDWKKLGLKLGFSNDELEYFAENQKEPAIFMLTIWKEQEQDDANIANLIYIMEGVGMKHIAETVFNL